MTSKTLSLKMILTLALVLMLQIMPANAQEDAVAAAAETAVESVETSGTNADNDGVLQIAVVDMERILREATAAVAIREQLDAARETFGQTMKVHEEELRTAEAELRRQRSVLAEDAFDEQRKAFEEKATSIQRKVQERNQYLEKTFNEAIAQLLDKSREIITKLAEERALDLVVTRRQVLLASKKLDLTEEVLTTLNAALPSVAVTVEPEAAAPTAE